MMDGVMGMGRLWMLLAGALLVALIVLAVILIQRLTR